MQYIVTIAMQEGPSATVTVFANSAEDAEYLACLKVESRGQGFTSHIISCRKCR